MDNTEISLSFKNNVSGENKLKEYEKRLQNIYSLLSGINGNQTSSLKAVETSTKNLNKETQETSKNTKKLKSNLDLAFDTAKLAVFTTATSRLFKSIMGLVSASSSYVENVNLLEVAYSNVTKDTTDYNKAVKESTKNVEDLINKMSKVYGFDESRLTRSFGIFKQMANAMKLPAETAENLSEHLVKMSNDIASLYNLDLKRAENALQSALAGQVRPIRTATGADITEKTLQSTVDAIGLDKSISELSYVEKRLVMIISLTDQLKKSQGDYGRTIESVSNQIRVMKEQWERLSRAVGNVFYPIIKQVLPYLNAVLMVLTEIFNLVASLLGFKMEDFDYSNLVGASDAVLDLEDSLDSASESADKLKGKMSGLRGFDKLNVISSPKDSGNASVSGGIDPKILDAFNLAFGKYNDNLDGIKMKATEIVEKFKEWAKCLEPLEKPLKEIAGLTYDGLVYVWENVLKPLGGWIANDLIPTAVKTMASALELVYKVGQKLLKIYKTLYETIVLPFARSIGNAIINSLKSSEKVLTAIAKSKFATTLLSGVVALKSFKTIISAILKTKLGQNIKALTSNLLDGVKGVKSLNNIWKNFFTLVTPAKLKNITSEMTGMQKATTIFSNTMKALPTIAKGAITAFAGFELIKGSFEDIAENGLSIGNVLSSLVGTILAVSGALTALNGVLSIFGVTLASIPIIGWIAGLTSVVAVIGGIIASTNEFNSTSEATKTTIKNINEAYDELDKKLDDVKNSYDNMLDSFNKNYEAKLKEIENGKLYINSLDEVVDGNYRVKDGYEAVANTILNELNQAYGTELTLEDGVIKNNGEIITGKQDLIRLTDEYAEAIKKQTLLEQYQAMYKQAIDDQISAKQTLEKTTESVNKEIEKTIKRLYENKITAEEADKVVEASKKKMQKATEKYNTTLGNTNSIIDGLGKVTETYAKGSSEELESVVKNITSSSKKSNEEINKSYESNLKTLKNVIKTVKKEDDDLRTKLLENSSIKYKLDLDATGFTRNWNKVSDQINKANSGNVKLNINYSTMAFPHVYASGGMPPVGQVFVANENGPELIGQIGGQSFVANQNQMMDLLDRKLGQAQSQPMNATFVIQVGSREVAREVINDLQGMAKSNGKPITIGG